MKHNETPQKKTALNLILSLMLLFLAVILCINAVNQFRDGAIVFSRIISITGTLLFGGVGICLLVGEIRQWRINHK